MQVVDCSLLFPNSLLPHDSQRGVPEARGRTAAVYLTGGGTLAFGEESSDQILVTAEPGRLVTWDSKLVHSFSASDEYQVRNFVKDNCYMRLLSQVTSLPHHSSFYRLTSDCRCGL